jgi:hypothetical protein
MLVSQINWVSMCDDWDIRIRDELEDRINPPAQDDLMSVDDED